ncbi:MAG: dolichyl-phosphate-mannose-protein mannosyltransferase [Isosphaeraceae bacterium]|nr:dolichyl-phosphate-mannose-protein mannosyltransferase [Isosphaeraceae bacterium]
MAMHRIRELDARYRFAEAALIILGMLARAAMIVQAGGCRSDPDNYLPPARSIAAGEGFRFNGKPTAYRPPLYPIVLAPFTSLSEPIAGYAIGGLHVVLGGITIAAVGGFVRASTSGRAPALVAMFLTAFDPVLVVQSRGVMTETLAAALTAVALRAAALPGARGAGLGGLAFGLSILCRPSLLPGAALASLARFGLEQVRIRSALLGFVLFWAVLIGVLTPWTLRNLRIWGEPVWATTHGGYTLALANNPFYYRDVLDGPPGAVWSGENQAYWARQIHRATLTMSEPEADRAIGWGAVEFMKEHPRQAIRASLARWGRFWGVAPSDAVYPAALRWATLTWTVPFWGLVAASLGSRASRSRSGAMAWAVVIGLAGVHILYWTDLRMRAPIVPALAALAAFSGPISRLGTGPEVEDPAVRI